MLHFQRVLNYFVTHCHAFLPMNKTETVAKKSRITLKNDACLSGVHPRYIELI